MAESSTNVGVPNGLGPNYFVNTIYTSPPSSSIVAINFKNGNDIAFNCSLSYDQEELVMKTKVNGQWQHMMHNKLTGFNWGDDQLTKIVVLINPEQQMMDVFVNITQFNFCYQLHYETSNIRQIQCEGASLKLWVGKALPNYEVGKVVYIEGQTRADFNIDMVPSLPQNYVTKDFVLHLSFRFQDNVVVRNHKVNEQWGADEREGNLSDFLLPGDEFCIRIVAQRTGFEIGVNGSHFCYFEYRAPFTSLSSDMSVQVIRASSIEKIEYS